MLQYEYLPQGGICPTCRLELTSGGTAFKFDMKMLHVFKMVSGDHLEHDMKKKNYIPEVNNDTRVFGVKQ